jgi:hypothetical protein
LPATDIDLLILRNISAGLGEDIKTLSSKHVTDGVKRILQKYASAAKGKG